MSKLIDRIKNIPREKTGGLRKFLCCNCLGEESITDPIFGRKKCLSCGATDFETIRIYITYWEPTGHEL